LRRAILPGVPAAVCGLPLGSGKMTYLELSADNPGKTTFAAPAVKYLRERAMTPILAIDADPSSSLNSALSMELHETVR